VVGFAVIGAGVPTLVTGGLAGAALIGVSMIPRAEIAMVVVHQGQQLGDWAMPERIYASMVFVTLVTCVGAPWILYHLLQRWPQTAEDKA
jgi:Kef-type K+ transport system membrane component KefB